MVVEMKLMIDVSVIALFVVVVADAHDEKPHYIMPASCVEEKENMNSCIENEISIIGYALNLSSIHECFHETKCDPQHDSGESLIDMVNDNEQNNTDKHKNSTEIPNTRSFHNCFRSKTAAQMDACVIAGLKFETVDVDPLMNFDSSSFAHSEDQYRRRRRIRNRNKRNPILSTNEEANKFISNGNFTSNLVDVMLMRAEICGVKSCVADLISDELKNDTNLAKDILCKAVNKCKMTPNTKCANERLSLAEVQCKCRQQLNIEDAKSTCQEESGFVLPAPISEQIGVGPANAKETDCKNVKVRQKGFYDSNLMGCEV